MRLKKSTFDKIALTTQGMKDLLAANEIEVFVSISNTYNVYMKARHSGYEMWAAYVDAETLCDHDIHSEIKYHIKFLEVRALAYACDQLVALGFVDIELVDFDQLIILK